jgi:hypothetical protein
MTRTLPAVELDAVDDIDRMSRRAVEQTPAVGGDSAWRATIAERLDGLPAPTPGAVAAELDALAARTGDESTLFQQPGGRPPKSDESALAEVRELLRTCPRMSRRAAILAVAKYHAPHHRHAFLKRVERKMARNSFRAILNVRSIKREQRK